MGGGIAALAAGIGLPVTLLDMPPAELTAEEQAKGLTLNAPAVRNRIVASLWDRQLKAKPPALFTADAARLVTLGNLEDDFDTLREADWIIEAIVEQLGPKQQLMARIDAVRKPTAIVSSNTSGIPIHEIAAGRSESFRRHFLGAHFFNPPRYLKLLEVIPTADTQPEIVQLMRDFGARRLGKGVVIAKDRPNFIANRIGAIVGQVRLLYALEHGYTVKEVDALTGPLIGNPKTATFRLKDLGRLQRRRWRSRGSWSSTSRS
jgi:3-hydroxyacyl-CoA dehydrogenase